MGIQICINFEQILGINFFGTNWRFIQAVRLNFLYFPLIIHTARLSYYALVFVSTFVSVTLWYGRFAYVSKQPITVTQV